MVDDIKVNWVGGPRDTPTPTNGPWTIPWTIPSGPYQVEPFSIPAGPSQPWTPPSDSMPYTPIQPNIEPNEDAFRQLKEILEGMNSKKKTKKKTKKKVARRRKVAKVKKAKAKKAKKSEPMTEKQKRDLLGGCEPRQVDLCCSTQSSLTFGGYSNTY